MLRRHPKWLVGFSDTTTLHLEALRAGVASLHADTVGGLGRGEAAQSAFVRALEAPTEKRVYGGLSSWAVGRAAGLLVGGNLSLLASAAQAGRLMLPRGALLAIEDVSEAAYRVDRMLTALIVGGHLDGIAGVVVGDFSECPPSRGIAVETVLRERLETLRVPVAAGLPIGHGESNEPLSLGIGARSAGRRAKSTQSGSVCSRKETSPSAAWFTITISLAIRSVSEVAMIRVAVWPALNFCASSLIIS
jgi:muramoyltetrapeptide carboxypeptidase